MVAPPWHFWPRLDEMKWLAFLFMLSSAGACIQYDVHTIIQRSVEANNASTAFYIAFKGSIL